MRGPRRSLYHDADWNEICLDNEWDVRTQERLSASCSSSTKIAKHHQHGPLPPQKAGHCQTGPLAGNAIERKFLPLLQRRHLAAHAIHDRVASLAVFVDDAIRAPEFPPAPCNVLIVFYWDDPAPDWLSNLKSANVSLIRLGLWLKPRWLISKPLVATVLIVIRLNIFLALLPSSHIDTPNCFQGT
jgi:hypothetical protein